MRRSLVVGITSIALAAAVGVATMTSASGKTALHFVWPSGFRAATVDVGHNGLGLGDRIAARGALTDETQNERVGVAYLQCIVHKRIAGPDKGLWNCNYVLELADGEIMLQGLDPRGPGEYDIAVLGGTGAYTGATGDATFTDVGTDAESYTDMVIRLGG